MQNTTNYPELKSLIDFCKSKYQASVSPNPNCLFDYMRLQNTNDCPKCLSKYYNYLIPSNQKDDYLKCEPIKYYYVLYNFSRYVAETYYMFHWMFDKKRFNGFPTVISVGCGPCSEAYGFYFAMKQFGYQNERCRYFGFDLDDSWKVICDENQNILTTNTFEYSVEYKDVFSVDNNIASTTDCVILNYMLSHMAYFNHDDCQKFSDNLVSFVLNNNISTLMYNDIPYISDDINWSYHWIDYIERELMRNGYKFTNYTFSPNFYSNKKGIKQISRPWPSKFENANGSAFCKSAVFFIYKAK